MGGDQGGRVDRPARQGRALARHLGHARLQALERAVTLEWSAAALALWIEPIGFVKLLVIMSVLGGLLTLVMAIIHFARN